MWMCQFGFSTAAEAGPSSQKAGERVGIDIVGTIKALRQVRLPGDDPSVPVKIRPLLTTLKHQLRDLISMTLNSYTTKSDNLENVRKALLSELEEQGITFERPDVVVVGPDYVDHGYTYGDIYQIAVHKITDHPELLAATTTIGVCCGSDTSLYIYERFDEEWKLLIAQEANDYEDVSGAQGRFDYAVSAPSSGGEFFLVSKNVNPWCSSNWQAIRYQVMRPGQAPYEPKVLMKQSDTIFLGNYRDGEISILPNGFTIQFDGGQMLDSGVLVRNHVVSYQVHEDEVQRVPPFADKPEGFLDEWFGLPWEQAAKWVHSSSALDLLREWHERLFVGRHGKDAAFFTEFVFDPPACQIKNGQWQIGLEFNPYKENGQLPTGMLRKVFFTVVSKSNAYFLKDVLRSGLRKCSHH
jgi:hypothetical protein